MIEKKNFPPRPAGMSQLDYLWLNFGDRHISAEVSPNPSDDVLLSEKAITTLVQNLLNSGVYIADITFDEDPLDESMMRLTMWSLNGSIIKTPIKIPKEVHVAGFVGRRATQADVDNGFKYPVGSQLLSITLTNGDEFLLSLEELNLVITGSESETIINNVENGVVTSAVKIDRGNTDISAVKIKCTGNGIYAHLEISEDETGIELLKEGGALKAKMPIGTTGYSLKVDNMTLAEYLKIPIKDPGTLYFITDVPYIYLGTRRYGVNMEPGDAPIVSIVYDPSTFTLAYKKADETDLRLIKLGPVSEIQNGI